MKYPTDIIARNASVTILPTVNQSEARDDTFIGFDFEASQTQPTFAFPLPLLAGSPREQWQLPGGLEHALLPNGELFQTDEYLFGVVSFADCNSELQERTRLAYDAIFKTLKQRGMPVPCRFWNFIPRINEPDDHGLERYRAFCAGRSQAFFQDIQAEEGFLPAGTGVGCQGEHVWVAFLATNKAAVSHLENPRQVPAYHYPPKYGPKSPSFARGTYLHADQGGLLMVSGTASIIGHQSLHLEDVSQQTQTTLDNIAHLISDANLAQFEISAKLNLEQMEAVRVYVRHIEHLPLIQEVVQQRLGSLDKVMFLHSDICRRELLVEIEGIIPSP